jgi:hypothetical protein
MALLLAQGAALAVGRGNCPLGPFQRRLGDPVPMFELVLPPRAAKAAIPILLVVAATGIVAVLLRPDHADRAWHATVPTASQELGLLAAVDKPRPVPHRGSHRGGPASPVECDLDVHEGPLCWALSVSSC